MQTLPIALAEADMVLARDVMRVDCLDGPPLCGKGVVLTAPLIMRLRNMGVQTVTVEGHPVTIEGEKTMEDLLLDLDFRFSRVAGNPRMEQLKGFYADQIRREMGELDGR
jgi:hypothetical protein